MNEQLFDQQIRAWLVDDAPDQLPDRVLRTTFERTRGSRQRRALAGLGRVPTILRQRWVLVAVGLLALAGCAIHKGEAGCWRRSRGTTMFEEESGKILDRMYAAMMARRTA